MKSKSKTSKKIPTAFSEEPRKHQQVVVAEPRGRLIIIGGHEDKQHERIILRQVSSYVGEGRLVVVTAASQLPNEMWGDYKKAFGALGVKDLAHLQINGPEDARRLSNLQILEGATVVFFTGGDQLKITSKIGGTQISDRLFEILNEGGTIAGTSAGASMMGETMMIGGEGKESHKVGHRMLAPGMSLMRNAVIDQHFAQRGRIGRLLGAVALNPGILGIGIDEDTAVIVEGDVMRVIGSNAVYIVDGHDVTYTNISEATADSTMAMHNVRLHVLADGSAYRLRRREPMLGEMAKRNEEMRFVEKPREVRA